MVWGRGARPEPGSQAESSRQAATDTAENRRKGTNRRWPRKPRKNVIKTTADL
jgi:hypothetical protein